MDLSKMSADDLTCGIKGQLIVYEDIDGPIVSKAEMADELARRLAAAEADNNSLHFRLRQAVERIEDLLEADDGQAHKEARVWLDREKSREAAQHARNAGGGSDE
jgi:hypothetical protein